MPTTEQVSAGGVVVRQSGAGFEIGDAPQVALIATPEGRWQLPKGLVNRGEALREAARREVREETGLEAELVDFIDKLEYWYYRSRRGGRVRFHKTVHFYLFRYLSGDVRDHDHEVLEARWFGLDEALETLSFKGEKDVLRRAGELAAAGTSTESL